MIKPVLSVLAAAALAGCGTVIDFGPEPGTTGDEGYWHYQPELHGPGARPRDASDAPAAAQTAPAAASAPTPATSAPAAPAPAAPAPAAPADPAPVAAAPQPPAPAAAPAPTSEAMFNDAIRRAVESGDIDRALRLLEEAERLGSQSARPTFIEAVGRRDSQ
jgi:hypothetical protein